VATGFSYLESPRWREGRLWLSDFYTRHVVTVEPATGIVETVCEVDGQPSGIGWLPDGSMLVVSMLDRRVLRLERGNLAEHADLSKLIAWPANDMVVDALGRAWVGNFGYDLMAYQHPEPTSLIRIDPDGTATPDGRDLLFPNGTVISNDESTLIVAETVGRRLTAFTIAANGSLSDRRTWADFDAAATRQATGAPVLPDGIALDAEGCLWVADALSGRVLRVAEGGGIKDEIETGTGAFACMLGGDDGTTLFICAAPSYSAEERRHTRDGVLLAVEVPVPHAGRP
jgi:sugar lactone lactonase YvrE